MKGHERFEVWLPCLGSTKVVLPGLTKAWCLWNCVHKCPAILQHKVNPTQLHQCFLWSDVLSREKFFPASWVTHEGDVSMGSPDKGPCFLFLLSILYRDYSFISLQLWYAVVALTSRVMFASTYRKFWRQPWSHICRYCQWEDMLVPNRLPVKSWKAIRGKRLKCVWFHRDGVRLMPKVYLGLISVKLILPWELCSATV